MFRMEYFDNNLANANAIRAFAEKKGITPAQLAIGWVANLGPHVLPLPGSSYVSLSLSRYLIA